MAKLKYTGLSWTQAGPEGLFVTPGQVVDLPLDSHEIAALLSTGDWEQLDGHEIDGDVQIFISHSSRDARLAKALIELLESALPLPKRFAAPRLTVTAFEGARRLTTRSARRCTMPRSCSPC